MENIQIVFPEKHTRLSASSSHRWISCPASIKLSEQVPKSKESDYAKEGTYAHEIAAKILMGIIETSDLENLDKEMLENIRMYTDYIESLSKDIIKIEHFISLSSIHPDIGGTCDCIVYNKKNKELHIIDFKYGQGVYVEAEQNYQLMIYALGALKFLSNSQIRSLKNIHLTIVQPRYYQSSEKIRTWTISKTHLFEWGLLVLKPASDLIEKENPVFHNGEHCRFCPAISICPQIINKACELAKTEFNNLTIPDYTALTLEDIAKIINFSEILSVWAKEVKLYAQEMAETGKKIPGYKLVQKISRRKWIDEEEVIRKLSNIIGEDIYEKKLISITQAEKLLKKLKLNSDLILEELYEKDDKGLDLVSIDNKRKEVIINSALDFIHNASFME